MKQTDRQTDMHMHSPPISSSSSFPPFPPLFTPSLPSPPLPSPFFLHSLLILGPDTDPSECKVTRQAVGKDLLKMKDTQFTFWSWFYQARELVISCLKQEWEAG